jgi:two-component sensor histidine kinase
MVIHELASNAVKFGSLSTPDGRLSVEWTVVADGTDDVLQIIWTENGGPAVKAPTRSGFGSPGL